MTDAENPNAALLELVATPGDKDPFLDKLAKAPPFSMRTLMLLEQIDSPFIRRKSPILDPTSGLPVIGPDGNPKLAENVPTFKEVMVTFYVMVNQAHPDILTHLQDRAMLERIVLNFAGDITPENVNPLIRKIGQTMKRVNSAAASVPGASGGAEKNETGPML